MQQYRGLQRLVRALEQLRDLEQISTSILFLSAFTRPGMIMAEMADEFGMSPAGVSRNFANLGDLTWDKKLGLGLLTCEYEHMVSSRHKRIRPTEEGAALAEKLERIIRP